MQQIQKLKEMKLSELANLDANVCVSITLGDLREFLASVVAEAEAARPVVEEEKYLTIKDVCGILGVTKGTLWRWDKSGYLKAIRIGRNPQYRMSDINHLREGKGA